MRRTSTFFAIALAAIVALAGCDRDEFGKRAEGDTLRADVPTSSDDEAGSANNANGDQNANGANNAWDEVDGESSGAPPLLDNGVDEYALQASGALAYKAYRAMAERGSNVVLSPIGLTRSFAVAGMATSDADVQAGILELLETNADPWTLNESVASTIAQLQAASAPGQLQLIPSVWAQEGAPVEEAFLVDLATYYDMGVQLVDFGAVDARTTINTWFRNRTEGYIVDAVAPRALPPETRLAFIDAAFFEGEWATGFDPDQNYDATFQGLTEDVTVEMMRKTESLRYTSNPLAEAVILPYDLSYSLVVILPREDSLATVEAALSTAWVEELVAQSSPRDVDLSFPRVEVGGRFDLDSDSEDFAFADAARADDAFANAGEGLRLGNILQRTTIRFEETSTIAVTPNTDENTDGAEGDPAAGISMPTMTLNRPFLFALRESQTGAVILLGRVAQPLPL